MKGKLGIFILDLVAVVLAAVLLSLPDYSGALWPLSFVALLPLLWRTHRRTYKAQFFIPFFAFFLYLTYVMVWIKQYGWQWLFLVNLMNSVTYALAFLLFFFIRKKLKTDLWFIILPMLFVVAEYGKSIGFLSFPWPYLSHSQYSNTYLIQICEFTGAWGVTFLLVWFNAGLFGAVTHPLKSRGPLAALPMLIAVAAVYIYGASAVSGHRYDAAESIQVSLLQRDVNTQEDWTRYANELAWLDYSDMTIREWTFKLDSKPGGFIVWPEGAIPDAMDELPLDRERGSRRELIEKLAEGMRKTIVLGTHIFTDRGPYNSAVVFGPDGGFIGQYNKVRVVPFGEVVPMEQLIKSWFPQYPWGSENLADGREIKGIDTPEGKIGIVICYESFFPDLTRRIVADGCDYLFLITNTSWFGRSKASFQHAHFDVFRAVENRIWLCRAATTGVSSFIDPVGTRHDETPLYQKAAVSRLVSPRTKTTLYTRYGDWFPRLCLLISLIMLTIAICRRN